MIGLAAAFDHVDGPVPHRRRNGVGAASELFAAVRQNRPDLRRGTCGDAGEIREERMKIFSRSSLAVALVAGSILPISLASAQEIEERTIKLAFVNAKDSAHDLGAKRFAEIVDEKSGG